MLAVILTANTAQALCVTQTVANSASITFSPSSQTVSVTAQISRTGAIVAPPPSVGCAAGANVNINTVTFSAMQFSASVSSPTPTGGGVGADPSGLHRATATIPGGTGAGTFILTARYNGSAGNAASSNTTTLTILPATQTITFPNPGSQTFSPVPVNLAATATSGLTITYATSTPAVCTVSGTTATMVTAGTCTLTANQAGNTNYTAAG